MIKTERYSEFRNKSRSIITNFIKWEILKRKRFVRNRNTLNTFCSIPEYVRYCTNRYHIGISEKKKAPETACFRCLWSCVLFLGNPSYHSRGKLFWLFHFGLSSFLWGLFLTATHILFWGLSLSKSRHQDFAHSRHLIDTVFAKQSQMPSPHDILLGFDKPR